jgi:uncharacterized protein (DUF427 family)
MQACRCSFGPSITAIVRTKGDCAYYSIPIGGSKSEYAVWKCATPYEAVASIKEYLALYASRLDAIEVIS